MTGGCAKHLCWLGCLCMIIAALLAYSRPAPVQWAAVDKPVRPVYDNPRELALIDAALVQQGYYRDDVPLSYDLQDTLHTACAEYGVDYALALAVVETESGFDPEAISPAGCYGLMQLNPQYFPADLPAADNIRAGIGYLGKLLAYYGDTGAALTAYNVGHDTGARGYANAVLEAAERWEAIA